MQQPTRVYLDNAATTPLSESARRAMQPYLNEIYGNASSPYAVGRSARMAIDRARNQVATLIGAHADEVVWTSGGTESDNWALLGVALRHLADGNQSGRGHIIVSAIEHHAVLEAAATLREIGFEIDTARVDGQGVVQPDEIARLLRRETLLVSVMLVNNEVGTVQPLREIVRVVKENSDALLHSDAVQAAGKIEFDVEALGIDLLSLSGHKFHGPKGAGCLWARRGVKIHPLLRGGGQERGRRAGTENVAAIAGTGAAAQEAHEKVRLDSGVLLGLRERLESGLKELGATINGDGAPRAPHVTNACFADQRAESLALGLDLQGLAVGTGSACASGAIEPSHVLAAMGKSKADARAALRISLGVQNARDDVDALLAALKEILK